MTPARKALAAAGVAVVAATWIYLVLVRPTDWDSVGGSTESLITLGGYIGGAILLLAATLPALPARTIAMIPVAIVLNMVIGQIVGAVGIPLYIDAVGTILMAALAGPIAGMSTGVLASVVWGLLNPAALPFAASQAMTGWLAGVLIHRFGAFKNVFRVVISGLIVGVATALMAAPVAAFVYGGTAGVGTGALVTLFRELNMELLGAVFVQSLISDPLDKVLVMLIVWAAIKAMPKKTLRSFQPLELQESAQVK
ncbi:ECF transporter S component [Corynebacterium sp. S7]